MSGSKRTRSALLLGVLVLSGGVTNGQSPPSLEQRIHERLQATEARIRTLEADLRAAPTFVDQVQPSAGAAVTDLDARLKKVETDRAKEREAAQARAEEAKSRPSLKVGGRIHLDYHSVPTASRGIDFFENPLTGQDTPNAIAVRRARFEFSGTVFDNVVYKLDLEMFRPNQPEFRDLFIGFTELPGNTTILVGNQKRPLGLEQLNSTNYNTFIERALPVISFAEDAGRRFGIAAYGYTDKQNLNWTVGGFAGDIPYQQIGQYVGDSFQWSFNTRLSGTPWYDEASGGRGYLHLGIHNMLSDPWEASRSPTDGGVLTNATINQTRYGTRPGPFTANRWVDTGVIENATWSNLTGLEAMLNVGPFSLTGEYFNVWLDRESGVREPFRDRSPHLVYNGGYVMVAYYLTGEHQPFNRQRGVIDRLKPFQNFFLVDRLCGKHGASSGWGAWQVAARYTYLDVSDDPTVTAPGSSEPIRTGILGGVERNTEFAVNWYFNAYARLMFNYIIGEVESRGATQDANLPGRDIYYDGFPGFTTGNFTAISMRLMVSF